MANGNYPRQRAGGWGSALQGFGDLLSGYAAMKEQERRRFIERKMAQGEQHPLREEEVRKLIRARIKAGGGPEAVAQARGYAVPVEERPEQVAAREAAEEKRKEQALAEWLAGSETQQYSPQKLAVGQILGATDDQLAHAALSVPGKYERRLKKMQLPIPAEQYEQTLRMEGLRAEQAQRKQDFLAKNREALQAQQAKAQVSGLLKQVFARGLMTPDDAGNLTGLGVTLTEVNGIRDQLREEAEAQAAAATAEEKEKARKAFFELQEMAVRKPLPAPAGFMLQKAGTMAGLPAEFVDNAYRLAQLTPIQRIKAIELDEGLGLNDYQSMMMANAEAHLALAVSAADEDMRRGRLADVVTLNKWRADILQYFQNGIKDPVVLQYATDRVAEAATLLEEKVSAPKPPPITGAGTASTQFREALRKTPPTVGPRPRVGGGGGGGGGSTAAGAKIRSGSDAFFITRPGFAAPVKIVSGRYGDREITVQHTTGADRKPFKTSALNVVLPNTAQYDMLKMRQAVAKSKAYQSGMGYGTGGGGAGGEPESKTRTWAEKLKPPG